MSLIAKASGTDVEPIPAGMHPAVCYGVIDLGTQPAFGQFPAKRKVLFLFELPEERADFERDGKKVNMPRAVSASFTLSLHKKSTLRPVLEGWRGREFTAVELEGFDVQAVCGANALLNITHRAGSGKHADRTFADVKAICPLPKGTAKRTAENQLVKFTLGDTPLGTAPSNTASLPDWIWGRIMQSEEYMALTVAPTQPQPTEAEMANVSGDEENVPF
tara:strand:+ start:1145 stop:1801 length:657 start_codon:yes stop_codon:yes gene_type:complete